MSFVVVALGYNPFPESPSLVGLRLLLLSAEEISDAHLTTASGRVMYSQIPILIYN